MATVKLTYSSNPDHSFGNKAIPLAIVATNNTGSDIVMKKGDSITITLPKDMLQDLNLTPSTPENSGYYAKQGLNAGEFLVQPNPFYDKGVPIKNKAYWIINFDNAVTSDKTGAYDIKIAELISGQTAGQNLPFQLEPPQLKVIAWLSPKYIGDMQKSTLFWQIPEGATKLYVSGFPNHSDVNIEPITSEGNIEVYTLPGPNNTQQIYSVTAIVGTNQITSRNVVLQKNEPIISLFDAVPYHEDTSTPRASICEIAMNEEIALNWITQYSNSVILTTPLIPNKSVFLRDSNVKFNPWLDIVRAYYQFFTQIPKYAVYYLSANGMGKQPKAHIRLKFKPAKLLWYKYTDKTKTSAKFKTDPENYYGAIQTPLGQPPKLTLYQPGGSYKVYTPNGILGEDEVTKD